MSESQIIERTPTTTTIRTGTNGQRMVLPNVLPILPIRNIVVFPGTVMPLNVGRAKSKSLLDEVMPGEKLIGVCTQKNAEVEDPAHADLNGIGVICTILKLFKLPDGNQSIIVHGLARFRLIDLVQNDPFAIGHIDVLEDIVQPGAGLDALLNSVRQQANRVIELSPNTPDEAAQVLNSITAPSALADFLAANLQADTLEKQQILEELDVEKRLRMIAARLATQLDVLELQSKIQSQVKENIDKSQRRYYLQEQLKAIRKELGDAEGGSGGSDVETLRQKLVAAKPPEGVMKEAERELNRLESIPSASPEYGVIRTYLQILGELPWSITTDDKIDLKEARAVLDRDHYDLDKVKRRIIEYLAVMKLKMGRDSSRQAPAILCFVGPPGVGKTSLGKSIAEAMGRRFIRVALGGVRDEADIRGHRRTYIGSMPGRIIAELRKAASNNPVMMLDEIDKLGADFRGDPSAALLEVLDPAQNHTFTDHYLDVPFDLSRVMFIATANTMDTVPGPLRDRMEVIEIPGYTESDKLDIAKRYLVPRQLESNGLTTKDARFNDHALRWIIEGYTREAGVRNLERQISAVARSIAAEIVGGKTDKVTVDREVVSRVLGPRRFEPELASRTSVPGVATGMAYTPVGGEILFIEASRFPGKGNITLTGQIGDVMKESATAAYSLLRSRAKQLDIDNKLLAESDIHIHIPAGAIPKDGPSAGVAMFTALASLMMNKPVRHDVAMTGEITLRGLVLPIGGLKEKTLAAMRAGIKQVLVPKRNEKDLPDIPEEVKKTLKFTFVENVDQVLAAALKVPVKKPAENGRAQSGRETGPIVKKCAMEKAVNDSKIARIAGWLLLLLGLQLSACAAPARVAVRAGISLVKQEFLYDKASFPSCHASTICQTPDGLVAAFFGGSHEGANDVCIWVCRCGDRGEWSAPARVAQGADADGKPLPCWNPVLFQPRGKPLMLFYKVGPSPSSWRGMLMTSDDGGKSWNAPVRLPSGILGPIKDKPIMLGAALLCPSSTEDHGWQVHLEWTLDFGKIWTRGKSIDAPANVRAIQPTLLLHDPADLQMLCRTDRGRIYQSRSMDGGRSWSELSPTVLPNPNSGIDAVQLSDGRSLLVYNDSARRRTPLNIAISSDAGKTWSPGAVLETEPGEYSYPAIIQTHDGRIHVVYTWHRQKIRHAVLELN